MLQRYFRQLVATSTLALGLVAAPAQSAVVLFQDNFDTDNASSVLNFNAFNNWTVSDGTVDYIRQGGFGISCFGGTGGCVDLDGSTANGGRMTSTASFTILAGETYEMIAQVSGNQRGGASDNFQIGLLGLTSFTGSGIAPGDPFAARGIVFSGISGTAQLFLDTTSADNIGVIVDNVTLTCLTCEASRVPEPGSLALLGLGLIGALGFARKRG